jgi:hypothetical protein
MYAVQSISVSRTWVNNWIKPSRGDGRGGGGYGWLHWDLILGGTGDGALTRHSPDNSYGQQGVETEEGRREPFCMFRIRSQVEREIIDLFYRGRHLSSPRQVDGHFVPFGFPFASPRLFGLKDGKDVKKDRSQ